MSLVIDSNTATSPATGAAPGVRDGQPAVSPAAPAAPGDPAWQELAVSPAADAALAIAVESALTAATRDATRLGDLFEALRAARLWLPLPDRGGAITDGGAVELPTVTYLGSEFVPAYTSGELLAALARPAAPGGSPGPIPHAIVRAADLARLLPPGIGIALNAGASESVPIYPPGVDFLAADHVASEDYRISVGPLPFRPEGLLGRLQAGLTGLPAVAAASAAWLSVLFSGEGMIISVTLDDPADAAARDEAVAVLERAANAAPAETDFPIDVTFAGESAPDHIDRWIAAHAEPFYRRGRTG
jgi:SseB protein N-terminal domain